MTATPHQEMLKEIERLPPDEQRQLLAELVARLEHPTEPKHSILEFRGVGKANPLGMDAQTYVDQERDAWEQPRRP